jgi:hypothetical protein
MGQFWRQHRDDVLIQYVRDQPGHRPPLWWRHDAPQPTRRRLSGSGSALYHPGDITWNGIPMSWTGLCDDDPPAYESEAAYLRRLGLLVPGEQRHLTAADYRPVYVRAHGGRVGLYRS